MRQRAPAAGVGAGRGLHFARNLAYAPKDAPAPDFVGNGPLRQHDDAWNWSGSSTFSNSVVGKVVSWTVSLASLGLSGGETIYFDVATSGGGNDPGVDHLSVVNAQSTSGWGSPSTSDKFLAYQVSSIPTPGAVALLGLAGLISRRRR